MNFIPSTPTSWPTTEGHFQSSNLYIKRGHYIDYIGHMGGYIDTIEGGLIYIDQVLSILTMEIKQMGISGGEKQ